MKKNNLFKQLESKMVGKELLEFKMEDGTIVNFSVDKKFLNTKITEMASEYLLLTKYMLDNNLNLKSLDILYMLFVKYFVKQLDKGKEFDVIEVGKDVVDNFEILIYTSNALSNIEDVDGNTLFNILIEVFDRNNVEFDKAIAKMKSIAENVNNNKDAIAEYINSVIGEKDGSESI